jgi:choline monooxygenase
VSAEPEPSRFLDEATYAATRRPVNQAETLIPDAYRSEEFFGLERERVFATSWVAVGYAERVAHPGDTILADVAGRPLIITRDRDGVLRAFHNTCRHRGTRLVREPCRLTRFRCPYRSWTYALDGRLLGAPLFEGSDIRADQQALFDMGHLERFDKADYGLLEARVAEWGHLVFATLDLRAMSLEAWLGDLPDRLAGYRLAEMTVVDERDYDVAANWKLIAENFMEYYHLPWVHPELAKVSRVEDHHRFQGPGMYTGMCTQPISSDQNDVWSALEPVPGLSDDDATAGRFVWITPNCGLAVLPNHVFTLLAEPVSVGRTRERTSLAVSRTGRGGADGEAAFAELAAFWDHLNREDVEVCEEVQAGLSSPAYPGGRCATGSRSRCTGSRT